MAATENGRLDATLPEMKPIAIVRALLATVALSSACGGVAATEGPGAAGQGTSTAGAGNAGTSPNGSSGAGASAGASGSGTLPGLCLQPEASGMCDGFAPSFWHNPDTGLCEPFVYGLCGGNDNRFATRGDCLAACPGGGKAWGACQNDTDCAATTLGCCGACEPLQDEQLVAINVDHVMDEQFASCMPSVTCGACSGSTEYAETGKYFKPVCVSGQCSLLDIRTSDLTACQSDADCVLRDGAACCSGCDGTGIVSVNAEADLCAGGREPCRHCTSMIPGSLSASCRAGHCALAYPTR